MRKKFVLITLVLSLILWLSSCTNANLTWRSGQLVAQLYRQYKQEILLAYNDFAQDMIVDQQHGYARAYFDNYRKQIIFQREQSLEYMIDGRQFTTATDESAGYISEVLTNGKYQIGVEILDPQAETFGQGQFWGTKSRIIDLNTQKSVTVDGLLFNDNLLVGDYFYGFTFSKSDRELEDDAVAGSEPTDYYLDIVDLRTMQHQKINTTGNEIRLLYRMGNQVYGQSESQKTAFLFDGIQMIEQKERYSEKLIVSKGNGPILKDIAPLNSNQHWYINPMKEYDIIKQASLLQLTQNDINTVLLDFRRDDIIQIMDVANYGDDKVALFLTTKDDDGKLHAIITVFDIHGKEVDSEDITHLLRGDVGRFTYLDYVK